MDRKHIAQLLTILDPQLANAIIAVVDQIIAVVDQQATLEARCRLLEKTAEGWQVEATKISNREIAGRVALAEQVEKNQCLSDGILAYRVRSARVDRSLSELDEADAWEAEHGGLVSGAGHPTGPAATLRGHATQEEDRDSSRPLADD